MARWWSAPAIVAMALLSMGSDCDTDKSFPTVVDPPNVTPTDPPVGPNVLPVLVLKTEPLADSGGVVRGTPVVFSLCDSVNPDPANRELYFTMDFLGNGTATVAGTTGAECRASFDYSTHPIAVAELCIVDRDKTTHAELHEYQCEKVTVDVAANCHSISSSNANNTPRACPTGNSVFCSATPIVATNPAQAMEACDACFGNNRCTDFGTYVAPFPPGSGTGFIYSNTGPCGAPPVLAGTISGYTCTTATGRWAP
jgi:hypothetical protein